jgi:FAD dependent oxidoreductase
LMCGDRTTPDAEDARGNPNAVRHSPAWWDAQAPGLQPAAGLSRRRTACRVRVEPLVVGPRFQARVARGRPIRSRVIDVTPDAIPVISAVERIPGFYIAAGFSSYGFGIGPGAGRLMADMVMRRPPLVDPTPFRLARFTDDPKPHPLELTRAASADFIELSSRPVRIRSRSG